MTQGFIDKLKKRVADWAEGKLHRMPPAMQMRVARKIDKLRGDERGIITIVGILMVVVTLMVFFQLAPTINSAIEDAINNSSLTGTFNIQLARMIPTFLLIMIIVGIFAYGSTVRDEGY